MALTVICLVQLMLVLDSTIVNVALPSIQHDLGVTRDSVVWVGSAYALTFGALLLFGGRTGDLFGRRRMFVVGVSIFGLASLLGGLATNPTSLIVVRALQGVGAAIASPTALSLLATNFAEGSARTRAMGVFGAVSGAGGGVGLLAGGVLVDLLSWRSVFFVNVPLSALAVAAAPVVLSESVRADDRRIDVGGAAAAVLGIGSLVFGLTTAASRSWTDAVTLAALAVAVVSIAVLVVVELRVRRPLTPPWLFADRNRVAAYLTVLTVGAALLGLFYFVSLYLQNVQAASPLRTGLSIAPFSVMSILAARVSSRLFGSLGARPLVVTGLALIAAGLGWLSLLDASSGYGVVLGPLLIAGTGVGTTIVPLTLTAVSGVDSADAGIASGLFNTGVQVGGAVGLSVLSTIAVSTTAGIGVDPQAAHAVAEALTSGYTRALMVAAIIVACAAVLAALLVTGRSRGRDVGR